MDAENNPAKNGAEAVSPVAGDKSAARWHLILLVLCAVGVGLLIGILALQVTEYLFYKAPPDVWPQPGAGLYPREGAEPAVNRDATAGGERGRGRAQVGDGADQFLRLAEAFHGRFAQNIRAARSS